MNRKELLAKLDEMLFLEPGTLTGNEALKDLSYWDSMAVLNFMSLLDESCGVTVAPDDISKCVTVGDLVALGEKE